VVPLLLTLNMARHVTQEVRVLAIFGTGEHFVLGHCMKQLRSVLSRRAGLLQGDSEDCSGKFCRNAHEGDALLLYRTVGSWLLAPKIKTGI
jgi:hypothetical protein